MITWHDLNEKHILKLKQPFQSYLLGYKRKHQHTKKQGAGNEICHQILDSCLDNKGYYYLLCGGEDRWRRVNPVSCWTAKNLHR